MSHHPTDRELLQGSIARNRTSMIDKDGDDAQYDIRSAEKARVVSSSAGGGGGKSQSLQELMRSQQAAMDVAEDRHNKEYIPLLNKAIEAIGGDPSGHHPSGGSGSTPRTSRSASRGTTPRSSYQSSPSNLKEMLASAQGDAVSHVNTTLFTSAPTLVGVATTTTAPLSPSRPSAQKGGLSPRGSSTTKPTSVEPNLRDMLREASNNAHQPSSPPAVPPRSPRPSPGRPSSPPGTVVQHARSPRSTSPNFRGGVIRTGSGASDRESLRDMLKDHHPLTHSITTTTTQHTTLQQHQPPVGGGSSSPANKAAAAVHDDLDSTIPYLDRTQNPN